MAEEGVRLNKFIAEAGIASRRAADRLIEDGHVTLNGRPAVLGDKVLPEDTVCVDGNPIKRETGTAVILAFNKPRGLECTSDHGNEDNVIDFINYPKRIFTIGRLDKESEGLLLLTNDGDLTNKIMRSRYGHEKEYVVSLDRDVTPEFIKGMASGVPIEEGVVTRKCKVFMEDPRTIRIILKQGLNRQIRKMCAYFGYGVVRLVRVRVMNIELGNLKSGRYRDISKKEREELMGILDKSTLAEKDN
ncbi:pseudouridine synthase [Methanomethylophilus alvi]|uniref:pseudouridine synthase n=1 Tax=Methanomethylophilus alvi TaxID=1291540 RepID=UPI0037DD4508